MNNYSSDEEKLISWFQENYKNKPPKKAVFLCLNHFNILLFLLHYLRIIQHFLFLSRKLKKSS